MACLTVSPPRRLGSYMFGYKHAFSKFAGSILRACACTRAWSRRLDNVPRNGVKTPTENSCIAIVNCFQSYPPATLLAQRCQMAEPGPADAAEYSASVTCSIHV